GGRTAGTGSRYFRPSRNPNEADSVPPLAADEQELMLTCYRSLRQRRPEWLTQAVVSNVSMELKRAKRTKDDEQIYKEAVEAATQEEAVQNVLYLAATRGDVNGFMTLFDKLEKLLSKRASSTPYYNQDLSGPFGQAMKNRADAKAHADILRLADRYLAYLIQKKKNAPSSSRSSSSA